MCFQVTEKQSLYGIKSTHVQDEKYSANPHTQKYIIIIQKIYPSQAFSATSSLSST